MIYRCRSGSQCKDTFTTERGLNIHRQTCNHYKRYEAAAFAKRKLVAGQQKKAAMNKRSKGKGKEDADVVGFGSVSPVLNSICIHN
jgi:IS4 transposase